MDIPPQKILGYNRQIYKQLKLALKLGLRRQIFVAVCDNLRLRNWLAARLEADMAQGSLVSETGGGWELDGLAATPKNAQLVSLNLDLSHPDPLEQIEQWLAEHPLLGQAQVPSFQILGVENLTRAAPAVQWFFLNGLREIERSLPSLEFSLLFWVPQPWCISIQQSAPEFWRSRTGVFEFEGEPTPLPGTNNQLSLQQWGVPEAESESLPLSELPILKSEVLKPAYSSPSANPHPPQQWLPAELVKLVWATAKSPEGNVHKGEPLQILQHIEQLYQQGAPAADLASAYLSLGNFYRDGLTRDRAASSREYLTIAIVAYEQVLHLNADPNVWADLANDLGNLYWMLCRYGSSSEEKISYLEQGIKAYQSGLMKVNPQTRSQAWAMIQNNLGAVYSELARYRDPAENLQQAVLAYTEALRHRQADLEAQDEEAKKNASRSYAATQNNLGTAHWHLAQYADPIPNLHSAIAAYMEALRYYKASEQPIDYSMIQNNLGTAYWNLAQYEVPIDNLLLAIGAYQIALRYRTPALVPAGCAATHNNLGTAYWHLANQYKKEPASRSQFLERAIAAYENAIAIAGQIGWTQTQTPTPLNFDIFATHNNLGLAHYQLVTEAHSRQDRPSKSSHLSAALHHHLQAATGWQKQPEFYQIALSYVVQTIRAIYSESGIHGQNVALSKIPGHLLPEIMRRL